MDLLTSNSATLALAAGAVVLLLGVAWALSAPHAPGRRVVPRGLAERAVSAILVLDGCALLALGAVWHLDDGGDGAAARGEPARTPVSGEAPPREAPPDAPDPAGAAAPPPKRPGASPEPSEPSEPDSPTAPRRPRRARAILVARLSGDGVSPGGGNGEARGGARLDVRPGRRHLCFDLAADEDLRGSITEAYVYRRAAGERAVPHLTLVVPDDKDARRRRGCARRPPAAALRAVVDRPEDFHVTFSDAAHPDGAIRGTLRTCRRPCATRAPDLIP